jgi:hypothetical protein
LRHYPADTTIVSEPTHALDDVAARLISDLEPLVREHAPPSLRRLDDWRTVDIVRADQCVWRIAYGTRRQGGGSPGASVQLMDGHRELLRVDIDLTEHYR